MEEIYKVLENKLLNRALLARLIYPELNDIAAKVKLSRQIKARKALTPEQTTHLLQVLEPLTNQLKTALNSI